MGRNLLVKARMTHIVKELDDVQEALQAALISLERIKRTLALRQFEALEPDEADELQRNIRALRKR